jgi:hypothetical protein
MMTATTGAVMATTGTVMATTGMATVMADMTMLVWQWHHSPVNVVVTDSVLRYEVISDEGVGICLPHPCYPSMGSLNPKQPPHIPFGWGEEGECVLL